MSCTLVQVGNRSNVRFRSEPVAGILTSEATGRSVIWSTKFDAPAVFAFKHSAGGFATISGFARIR
jgi:hypothetical protein